MKVSARFFCALALALCTVAPAASQEPAKSPYVSSPRRAFTAPELLDAPDEWIARSLGWVGEMLAQFPPALPEHPVRRAALIRLDDILHIQKAPEKPLVQEFFRNRIEKAIREIEASHVSEGVRIWKLYNHGFFIRTPTVSFAFDIVPGTRTPGFSVDLRQIEKLAEQADVLLITHMHNDHANRETARLFIGHGKAVIAPEGLWADEPELSRHLIYPERSSSASRQIRVQGGKYELKLTAYPGHQGTLINNVYSVSTPEDFTVVHTGDQSSAPDDFDWMWKLGASKRVDLLLPNCWTTDIQGMARGINPKLIIPGHENEMGHAVDHREDYTQSYNHLFGTAYPYLIMSWGESYLYRR